MPKSIIDYTIREFLKMDYQQWSSLQKGELEIVIQKAKLIHEAATAMHKLSQK